MIFIYLNCWRKMQAISRAQIRVPILSPSVGKLKLYSSQSWPLKLESQSLLMPFVCFCFPFHSKPRVILKNTFFSNDLHFVYLGKHSWTHHSPCFQRAYRSASWLWFIGALQGTIRYKWDGQKMWHSSQPIVVGATLVLNGERFCVKRVQIQQPQFLCLPSQ